MHSALGEKEKEKVIQNYKIAKEKEESRLKEEIEEMKIDKEDMDASELIQHMMQSKIKQNGGKEFYLKAKKGLNNSNIQMIIKQYCAKIQK